MRKTVLLLIVLLGTMVVNAQEFWIKSSIDNSIEGPFEFKDGGDITLKQSVSIIRDVGKFGKNSFTLEPENGGKKFGPFQLKNNASINIANKQCRIFIADNSEQPAKQNTSDSRGNKPIGKTASDNSRQQVKQNYPAFTENKSAGLPASDLFVKFETALGIVESNFEKGIIAETESDWLSEYQAKFVELKNLSREFQDKIIKQGIDGDFNIPKSVNIMYAAFLDCRKRRTVSRSYNPSQRVPSSSQYNYNVARRKSNSYGDVLTNTEIEPNRHGDVTRSTYSDFNLAVAHLKEDLAAIKKLNN